MDDRSRRWERWFWRSKEKEDCGFYEVKVFSSARLSLSKKKVYCMHPYFLHRTSEPPPACEGDRVRCVVPRGKRII